MKINIEKVPALIIMNSVIEYFTDPILLGGHVYACYLIEKWGNPVPIETLTDNFVEHFSIPHFKAKEIIQKLMDSGSIPIHRDDV